MLDHDTQNLLAAALQLPASQQFQLIDALLDQGAQPTDLHVVSPPLSQQRLEELVQEGKDALADGKAKTFSSSQELTSHVGEIFDQAIQANRNSDSSP